MKYPKTLDKILFWFYYAIKHDYEVLLKVC